jgi:hypothetical protein
MIFYCELRPGWGGRRSCHALRGFHELDAMDEDVSELQERWRRLRIGIDLAEGKVQDVEQVVRGLNAHVLASSLRAPGLCGAKHEDFIEECARMNSARPGWCESRFGLSSTSSRVARSVLARRMV